MAQQSWTRTLNHNDDGLTYIFKPSSALALTGTTHEWDAYELPWAINRVHLVFAIEAAGTVTTTGNDVRVISQHTSAQDEPHIGQSFYNHSPLNIAGGGTSASGNVYLYLTMLGANKQGIWSLAMSNSADSSSFALPRGWITMKTTLNGSPASQTLSWCRIHVSKR